MTGTTWFAVENNIVDRNDLTIYEKMCCIVLARYAGRSEFSNMLNLQVIAIRMGCDVRVADETIKSLMQKGLIALEDTDRIEPDQLFTHAKPPMPPSNVIHYTQEQEVEPKPQRPGDKQPPAAASWLKLELEDLGDSDDVETSETMEVLTEPELGGVLEGPATTATSEAADRSGGRPMLPKQLKNEVQSLVDQLYEIIDENINEREARIILSFAGNNIDLIREKYELAKLSPGKDKIERLMDELQKKDAPVQTKRASRAERTSHEEIPSASQQAAAEEKTKPRVKQANQQVDLNQINSMAAYKQSSYGKKTK